jgi:hypothetical protein
MKNDATPDTTLALFQESIVRRIWYQDTWYFSIIDVVTILADTNNARRYWSDLKRKLEDEGYFEVYEKIVQLKMKAQDGKNRVTDAADTQTLLRIVQSISSPRAEPFKRWLAEVGTQRLEEIENPEAAIERMRATLEAKGYPQGWIEIRMRSIAIRNELTQEWEERGAKQGLEFAILTNEIADGTFGVTIQEHKGVKKLKKNDNIRDHETDLELILTMLGDATATKLHQDRNTQGFPDLQIDAREAGEVAGSTRRDIEMRTGTPVVSASNYLHLTEGKKRKKQGKDGKQPQLPLPDEQ